MGTYLLEIYPQRVPQLTHPSKALNGGWVARATQPSCSNSLQTTNPLALYTRRNLLVYTKYLNSSPKDELSISHVQGFDWCFNFWPINHFQVVFITN
ncbi:hypothetical protein SCLCIDRAFT_34788 [Scleroderma citrinum Foug A]|uniref:Uncharacterized protein n=1 Tax=Scleroderma citrinum Foug A TaxID=1036808 RepID=A0A0C3D1J9_9AGAM|nr:hypothetical protein SCLCIDRAFT_34788 [Scleroderma citrinum Foug A]